MNSVRLQYNADSYSYSLALGVCGMLCNQNKTNEQKNYKLAIHVCESVIGTLQSKEMPLHGVNCLFHSCLVKYIYKKHSTGTLTRLLLVLERGFKTY